STAVDYRARSAWAPPTGLEYTRVIRTPVLGGATPGIACPHRSAREGSLRLHRIAASPHPVPFSRATARLALALGVSGLFLAIILRLAVPWPGQLPDPPGAASVHAPSEIPEDRPATIAAPLPSSYTVEAGDTLFDIALELD